MKYMKKIRWDVAEDRACIIAGGLAVFACCVVAGAVLALEGWIGGGGPPKHYEVPHTLNDGTPCVILRDGWGGLGITCDYTTRVMGE